MYFILVWALVSTFIYVNLILSDAINARINPYSAGKEKEEALLLSKIKYVLLIMMAFSWGAVIRFW